MVDNEQQLLKADAPIEHKVEGNDMEVNCSKRSNALSPISTTPSGIVRDVRYLAPAKE